MLIDFRGDVKQMEAMRDQIEESQGMDYLEDLQNSDSEKVNCRILRKDFVRVLFCGTRHMWPLNAQLIWNV